MWLSTKSAPQNRNCSKSRAFYFNFFFEYGNYWSFKRVIDQHSWQSACSKIQYIKLHQSSHNFTNSSKANRNSKVHSSLKVYKFNTLTWEVKKSRISDWSQHDKTCRSLKSTRKSDVKYSIHEQHRITSPHRDSEKQKRRKNPTYIITKGWGG